MKKWFLLVVFIILSMPVEAVEFKPLESPNVQESKEKSTETPKGLLNDENYKIKGRVEYDNNGVLFLDSEDIETLNLKVNLPKKYPKKSVLSEKNIFSQIEEQHRLKTPKVDEYLITPTFGALQYENGNFSYGATFGTEMDTAQLEYRTKFFAQYDNRFFGIMTAVGKDEYTSSGEQMSSIYFAPELKLTKTVSLAGVIKANPEHNRCRNDIMLRYSPKIKNQQNKLQLEAGVSQMSYFNTGEQYYQFTVSTKYHF